ncbi:MAG: EamA family transporter, partial [Chloroflexi bacterium]|nr:EamA family transporter [Chloroflexota bacterium]
MSWIAFALAATFLIGVGSILEKLLISRYLPGSKTFLGWLALSMIPHCIIFAFVFPVPDGTPFIRIIAMVGTGACWGMSGNLMYRALQRSEASRVWPVLNVSPIYVAIMAVFLLGEILTGLQWGAIILAVFGTILISISFGSGENSKRFQIDKPVLGMLIIASLLMAVGQVIAKYGLEEVPPLSGFWLMRIGMFASMSLNFSPTVFRNMVTSLKSPKAMWLVGVAELLIFPAAILMLTFATDLGPVSLVSTLNATVPIWVFVLSTIFSIGRWNLLNE